MSATVPHTSAARIFSTGCTSSPRRERATLPARRDGPCAARLRLGPKALLLTADLDVVPLRGSEIDHRPATVDDDFAHGRAVRARASVQRAHGLHVVEQEAEVK